MEIVIEGDVVICTCGYGIRATEPIIEARLHNNIMHGGMLPIYDRDFDQSISQLTGEVVG